MANHPNRNKKKQTLALTREEWTVIRKALDTFDEGDGNRTHLYPYRRHEDHGAIKSYATY